MKNLNKLLRTTIMLIALLALLSAKLAAQDQITLTWQADAGSFQNLSVQATDKFTVNWGDGTPIDTSITSHTYTVAGEYIVTIAAIADCRFISLNCSGNYGPYAENMSNQVSSLALYNCSALTALDCGANELTSLDISQCPNLVSLNCPYNQLTNLDVSSCPDLQYLRCSDNQQIIKLDVIRFIKNK